MVNILLTGASRGIGAAAHRALTAAGHHVIGQSTAGGSGCIVADFAVPRAADALWQQALAASGGGRIINVASRAGHRGDSPAHWHYAAAKAGMIAMTKTIARGYALQNILAFAVAPGFTMTGMAEEYLSSRGGEKLLADIPLGKVADAEEVAEAIRWLASDAPPSLTGSTLDINGASYVR
jgi:NAD(P)-dependent dehydrogenase (short-subunit alcohol dehydrogenase family)